MVAVNTKCRPFADGGGLCSPGRWAPDKRGEPKLPHIRQALLATVRSLALDKSLKTAAETTAFKTAPWDVGVVAEAARVLVVQTHNAHNVVVSRPRRLCQKVQFLIPSLVLRDLFLFFFEFESIRDKRVMVCLQSAIVRHG